MKLTCNRCKTEAPPILTHKIIPTQEHLLLKDPRTPKYTVMIKGSCPKCKEYIKFVKQTPEVIEEVNNYLELTYAEILN